MLVRNPAHHDMILHSRSDETAAFKPYDQQHVRDKFPQASEQLVLCLGGLITRRRRYLKYRERHSIKLGKGLEELQDGGKTSAEDISETMASEFQAPEFDFGDVASISSKSATSYASSDWQEVLLRIPAPPAQSLDGKPFVCPYCFYIIEANSTRSWHRHIFTDLRPYSCVFEDCRWLDQSYPSRREWFTHVCGTHDLTEAVCPLCKDFLRETKLFERHVARHLVELALFALPRDGTESEEQEEIEDSIDDKELPAQDDSSSLTSSSSGLSDSEHGPKEEDENEVEAATVNLPAPNQKSSSNEERTGPLVMVYYIDAVSKLTSSILCRRCETWKVSTNLLFALVKKQS